jgi:UMF1 family MFS transporter
MTLEQMARDRGFLESDKTTRCSSSWDASPSSTVHVASESSQCVVYFLGMEINTASFAMYTFSVSVLLQALLIISMSGAADHGSYRKLLLVVFACVGSVSTMLFLAVKPEVYLLGALLAIIANTCFGASFVLLNSFLPVLVRHHPAVLKAEAQTAPADMHGEEDSQPYNGADDFDSSLNHDVYSPLLQSRRDSSNNRASTSENPSPTVRPESVTALQLSTRISSNGMGIGYIGAVILQVLCIGVVMVTHQTTFSLRLVLFLIGLWWLLFTVPAILWLRPRPGPPLPFTSSGKHRRTWLGYMAYSWKSLGKTLVRARRLRDVGLFLAAWFLLSDGIATVSGTAVLFAKTQLGMRPAALGWISVVGTISGVCGAFSWSYISHLLNLRATHTIIACICLFELVPLYGLLGFIPAIKDLGFLGLQNPWEMFPLSAVFGLVMGGLSSYCRSFFGELIPPGYETAFYALFAITDKGSSVFGPAIVGLITDRYGEIRPAFVFLAVLVFCPLPLMLLVDVDRGKRDALALAADLEGRPKGTMTGYRTVPTIQLLDEERGDLSADEAGSSHEGMGPDSTYASD